MRISLITALLLAGFSATAAQAADLVRPVAAVVPAAPSAAYWNGFYAGVFGGLGASNPTFDATPVGGGAGGGSFAVTGNGFIGGARAGYDYNLGNVVLGVSADIAASNVKAEISVAGAGLGAAGDIQSQLDWFGTVQARLGVPVTDDLLLYAHGGFAYGHTTQSVPAGLGGLIGSAEQTRAGWVIGAGAQVAVAQNITLNAEYSYVDLGKATIASVPGGDFSETTKFHAITAGLNFHF